MQVSVLLWPFLSVDEVLNGAESDFRFVLESGRSECTGQGRPDGCFWPKADILGGAVSQLCGYFRASVILASYVWPQTPLPRK